MVLGGAKRPGTPKGVPSLWECSDFCVSAAEKRSRERFASCAAAPKDTGYGAVDANLGTEAPD